ncbi:hypothetical protein EDB81DRAFT_409440 [Dactylonectria macrodidyma]|uniref:Secreted protein n=1 Tax=Dactylonectria macrodidyma TaxID=307937 RepID=A0A9P9FAI8_9HYPO|nr:hypothetical protein EDB81DRAFT_409440 [Dactylonectria macrodidyma]
MYLFFLSFLLFLFILPVRPQASAQSWRAMLPFPPSARHQDVLGRSQNQHNVSFSLSSLGPPPAHRAVSSAETISPVGDWVVRHRAVVGRGGTTIIEAGVVRWGLGTLTPCKVASSATSWRDEIKHNKWRQ